MGRALKKIALGFGVTLLVIAMLALVAYLFGGPTGPSEGVRTAYDDLVTQGLAEPVESHFVIPIPGCVCHSDDPALIVQHGERRIRDCSSCH